MFMHMCTYTREHLCSLVYKSVDSDMKRRDIFSKNSFLYS